MTCHPRVVLPAGLDTGKEPPTGPPTGSPTGPVAAGSQQHRRLGLDLHQQGAGLHQSLTLPTEALSTVPTNGVQCFWRHLLKLPVDSSSATPRFSLETSKPKPQHRGLSSSRGLLSPFPSPLPPSSFASPSAVCSGRAGSQASSFLIGELGGQFFPFPSRRWLTLH